MTIQDKIRIKRLKKRLIKIYQSLNQRTEGRLEIIKITFRSFSQNRASRAAAGMTYYTLFSLFPLLIVMVTVGSFFAESEKAINKISQVMTTAIPVSNELVQKNIQRVLDLRSSVGVLGLIGFIWSASNAFTMLADNINQAFPRTELRTFFKKRLVAFGILGVIIGLLVLLMLSSTLLSFTAQFKLPFVGDIDFFNTSVWPLITSLSPWVFSSIFFMSLYLWVPNTKVNWQAAIWSATTVMILWRATSIGFTWYLSSGLTSYELVYGSLSAIIILLFWIYISSLIIFFGAHLCAAINEYLHKDDPQTD
jgi:membrane protein